jgi:hypothetical protein
MPVVILLFLCGIIYPPITTPNDRRISAFPIGGRTRLIQAGGASLVRSEALVLMNSTTHLEPPREEWPASIKALGAVFVQVYKNSRTVKIYLPRTDFVYADQFYFLIREAATPLPDVDGYADGAGRYRRWKIAEGIYLYETD